MAAALLHHVATEPAAELAEGERPGLLLLLHGSGDSEHGLLPLGVSLAPPNYKVVSLRAPLSAGWGPGAYREPLLRHRPALTLSPEAACCAASAKPAPAPLRLTTVNLNAGWFEGMSRQPDPEALAITIGTSCDALFAFIEAAPELLGTDPSKVSVLGFSQGATITWTALLSRWPRPGLISAAVAISGRLMPELLQAGTPLNERLAPASQTAALPLFASHGMYDHDPRWPFLVKIYFTPDWRRLNSSDAFYRTGAQDPMTPVEIGRDNRDLFTGYSRGTDGAGEGQALLVPGGRAAWYDTMTDEIRAPLLITKEDLPPLLLFRLG